MSEGLASAPDRIGRVTAALEAVADPQFQAQQQRFSKEPIQSMGVRTLEVRKIAKAFWPDLGGLSTDEVLGVCEQMLQVGTAEHRCIALTWAFNIRRKLLPGHYHVFFAWLNRYVADWASCDQLCCEVFGDFMMRYPSQALQVRAWARSENRWLRRAAAVVLIPELRSHGQFVPLALEVATLLLADRDDLVQKGSGWALKISLQANHAQTWPFILQHKSALSRTALRYAVEQLSPAQKAEALKS